MPPPDLSVDAVRAELARILESSLFASSTALSQLLRFTVEKTLAREADFLKEYCIATEVFHRKASFDPEADSIVRVQARKLRKRLLAYYEGPGRLDPVRIECTPGSYVPRFVEPAPAPPPDRSGEPRIPIAVLPFLNLSPALESAYFCDGLTEELIYALSRNPSLRVVARSSSFQFKGSSQDVRLIGRKLGAEYVVEGSVRSSDRGLRVTAELVNVADGFQVWSQRFDRTLSDVFRIQEEIAHSIAGALCSSIPRSRAGAPAVRPAPDLAAYDLYLKGRYHWNQRTEEGFARAVQYYEQAILKDPAFAKAYAGLAETYVLMMMHNLAAPLVLMPKARTAALAALSIEPELASAHSSLAAVRMLLDRDPQAAESEWRHALRLDPDYATLWHWYGIFCLAPQGRAGEALDALRRAEALDPFSVPIANDVGFVLYYARRLDEAIAQCRKALSLNPYFYRAILVMGRALAAQARCAAAVEHCLSARAFMPGKAFLCQLLGTLGFSYAAMHSKESALAVLEELQALAATHFASPFEIAIIQAALGAHDEALDSLEQALEQRSGWAVMLPVEPLLDPVRNHPRFASMLHRLYAHPGR